MHEVSIIITVILFRLQGTRHSEDQSECASGLKSDNSVVMRYLPILHLLLNHEEQLSVTVDRMGSKYEVSKKPN